MRARVIVFPVRGRNWCFSRSIEPLVSDSASSPASQTPSTLKGLWKKYNSNANDKAIANPLAVNAELLVDFVSTKMNIAWIGLEKSPQGSFKNKIHGLGLKLLSRVKPSEIFLKSISNEVTGVEVKYPSSLNARLVRRRLRHIAMRGSIIHKKYLYGSVTLLPLTSACAVLPLPNIPFFWCLFRTYSHWRALKGSEKLLKLVSDSSVAPSSTTDYGVLFTYRICIFNNKQPSCFYPIPQAADCIIRVAERANAPVVYLSTDAAESETGLLQSLVVVNGKTVPLVKRPARNSAEKWDALLYRQGIEGDAQVEAMLDKTICAMSSVFIGASGSTFTEDILRLRKDWGSASLCDEYLCQGENPNFIAENE